MEKDLFDWTIWKEKIKNVNPLDGVLVILMIVGLGVLGWGILGGIMGTSEPKVEYISAEDGDINVWVDISGAVMKPGVYQLSENARMKDVLAVAGGLSEKADRDYVERVINMAEKVKDGQKVFIPNLESEGTVSSGDGGKALGVKVINVNLASASQLEELWGVGVARADSIIKNRPYSSLDDLVKKKVLTQKIIDNNKGVITF